MTNLKFYLLLMCCFTMGGNFLNAQKAKFKNDACKVQKTRLPVHYSEPGERTYDLYTKGAYSGNVEAHGKKLYGWTVDQDNPSVKAVVSIYGFTVGRGKRTSEKKEKKDKDGKVTDRWTEYKYSGEAVGKGTLYMYGLDNPFQYDVKKKKKSKWEEKQEAKAAAEKKALAANPFLSDEDVDDSESDISEDSGLDSDNLTLVRTSNVDQSKSVTTGVHRSSSSAYKEYLEVKRPQLYDFKSTYPQSAYNRAISNLNYYYGFTPVKNTFYMRKMKTEKHAEYKMWNSACQAAETLFKPFKYNQSIDDSQVKFDPIVEYFEKQLAKIPDGDKKQKKMQKAAFQNLTNILYYLDRHDDVIAISKKKLDSKYIDKIAERAMEKSERMNALLAFHKMENCHFVNDEEVADGDIEEEEADDDDDEEGTK